MFRFDFQPLERRLHLTVTPSSVLTKAIRQDLLNHWSGSNKASLQSLLDQSKVSAFDSQLLGYMRSRSGPNFFFDPSDAQTDANYIEANFNVSGTTTNANAILNHQFPQQGSAQTYDVQLPAGDIDWLHSSGASSNPEFPHALNRHSFWMDLANAYLYSGNAAYMTELTNELASWSSQATPISDPNTWASHDPPWQPLDTGMRAESWTWTYFEVLSSADWSAAANTLFLYKIQQHGDFLRNVTLTTMADNRAITNYKGLLYLGDLFPEFSNAASWQSFARSQLFVSMDLNRYPDGSDVEQSVGYSAGVVEDLLEAKWLDTKNGVTWPSDRVTRLDNAVDSSLQLLSPDDRRAAIGDTYRTFGVNMFFKARLIEGSSSWPAPKPEPRDVWLFGPATVGGYLGNSVTPALGNRGTTYAMTDSGNYIMRSDNSANARQIIFDAGPKGGAHGHFDLLNFELFGYGRPLISDPGLFKYDNSADRQYVISTKAHNTINIDGANTGALEGSPTPGIDVSQWATDGSTYARITATHRGYAGLYGRPVVTRSMWYDLDGTILIVDWGESSQTHTYQQSFNLQTLGDTNNVTVDGTSGSTTHIRTRYSSGGNVYIQPLDRPGQTASRGALTFVSNTASGDYKDDAYRFTVTNSGTFVVFATLILAYNGTGSASPNTTATLLTPNPAPGGNVQIQLVKNGTPQTITFTPPTLQRLDSKGTNRGVFNDIAYDSAGRLHMAFSDRDDRRLKYTVRDTNGKWSIPETIDLPVSMVQPGGFGNMSLKIDNAGNPGIAYRDDWNADLKYAHFNGTEWSIQTIETKGATGLYADLGYSRNGSGGAVIAYYNRTKGELRLASEGGPTGWTIQTIDARGDVGRFPSLLLDPNRPTVSKFAIAYEANGTVRFAMQGLFSGGTQIGAYTIYDIDHVDAGTSYESLAFYDSGTTDFRKYKPAISYYDGTNTALKYAKCVSGWDTWSVQTVASDGSQGQYSNLYFDSGNHPTIYYYDRTHTRTRRAIYSAGAWKFSTPSTGGQEIHLSLFGANVAFSDADATTNHLYVLIV